MINRLLCVVGAVVALLAVINLSLPVYAANEGSPISCEAYKELTDPAEIPEVCKNLNFQKMLQNGISIFLLIVGILATIMIIFGGFRYIISSGDEKKIVAAKNTILYSVIGLVIALLAGLIVNFVIFNAQ